MQTQSINAANSHFTAPSRISQPFLPSPMHHFHLSAPTSMSESPLPSLSLSLTRQCVRVLVEYPICGGVSNTQCVRRARLVSGLDPPSPFSSPSRSSCALAAWAMGDGDGRARASLALACCLLAWHWHAVWESMWGSSLWLVAPYCSPTTLAFTIVLLPIPMTCVLRGPTHPERARPLPKEAGFRHEEGPGLYPRCTCDCTPPIASEAPSSGDGFQDTRILCSSVGREPCVATHGDLRWQMEYPAGLQPAGNFQRDIC